MSATGPYASVASVTPSVLSMPTAEIATPYCPSIAAHSTIVSTRMSTVGTWSKARARAQEEEEEEGALGVREGASARARRSEIVTERARSLTVEIMPTPRPWITTVAGPVRPRSLMLTTGS